MSASPHRFWAACCAQVKEAVPARTFDNWFKPLEAISVELSEEKVVLSLAAPSKFHVEMVRERYYSLLQEGVTALRGVSLDLSFTVMSETDDAVADTVNQGTAASEAEPDTSTPTSYGVRMPSDGELPAKANSDPTPVEAGEATDSSGAGHSRSSERPPAGGAARQKEQGGETGHRHARRAGPGPEVRAASPPPGHPQKKRRGRLEEPLQRKTARGTSPSSTYREAQDVESRVDSRKPNGPDPIERPYASTETPSGTSGRFRPSYTFERFIAGDCNQLARSAALAIADDLDATNYNPFMVYGGVGLGKTHLAQAMGNRIHQRRPRRSVVYVSGEQFTTQFVHAIQTNSISEFTQFYRQIDVLIVDDVQFFSGKEKTQEEFFHVFNALYQDGKQIVLCADRPPKKIVGIEERLLSRFQWGLSADVQVPDLETRLAILQCKAEVLNFAVPPDVIEYIAHSVQDSIRKLEGALARLKAHQDVVADDATDLSLSLAKRFLSDIVDHREVSYDVGDIMEAVADYYHLDQNMLPDRTRKQHIVKARQLAMYFSRKLTDKSLSSIGDYFGGRDHSTVVHAINTVEDRLDTEDGFQQELDDLRHALRTRGVLA